MLPKSQLNGVSGFSRRKLSSAILMALVSASAMTVAHAQENEAAAEGEGFEKIVITSGYRGSLISSLNDKRFGSNIQDGISAEDLGKFPDQNVAESLQRITGVSIDREDGEGQKVSIRGFGPDFNTSLYNNRILPSDDDGRSFSYDVIASELISGAEVYKTSQANQTEGGIGGTVNLTTAKPLDFEGFKGAASVKGVYDSLAESTNPYISALVSQNFNDKFGVLASFAYQQRDARKDEAYVDGYVESTVIFGDDPTGTASDEKYWRPQSAGQTYTQQDRERIGGTLALQWRPTDNLTVTLDTLYTRLKVEETATQLSRYFSAPLFNAEVDGNGTVVDFDRVAKPQISPGVYELWSDGVQNPTGQWNSVNLVSSDRDSTTKMFGLNLDWQLNDDMHLAFDAQSSSGRLRSPNNPAFTLANPTQTTTHFSLTGDTFNWSGTDAEFMGDKDSYMANNMYLTSDTADDEVTEAHLDFNWVLEDMGPIRALNAGLYYSDRSKTKKRYETPWTAVTVPFRGFFVNIPSEYLYTVSPSGGFLSDHDEGGFVNQWYSYDANAIIDYLMSDEVYSNAANKVAQLENNIANGSGEAENPTLEADTIAAMEAAQAVGFAPQLVDSKSWKVEEQNFAAYTSLDLDTEVAGMALTGNVGLRYIHTNLDSWGNGATFVGLLYDYTQSSATAVTQSGVDVHADNSYSELLPSLNLKLDINDEMVSRFAYSKTLTRPDIDDLSPSVSISNTSVNTQDFDNVDFTGYISGDNPELTPYTSQNYDLAFEWYYSDDSYAGVTVFYKRVQDWIVTSTFSDSLYDTYHDVMRNFERSSPLNADKGDATGTEFAWLHSFDSGFGAQFNYTYLDSTLDGLSKNSFNLVGFYENEGLQARLAYNWRDSYTQCGSCARSSQPIMVEAYGQVDASFSYDLNDNLTLTADVINLLGEDPRKYSIYESRFLSLADTGTRYSLGLRSRF